MGVWRLVGVGEGCVQCLHTFERQTTTMIDLSRRKKKVKHTNKRSFWFI